MIRAKVGQAADTSSDPEEALRAPDKSPSHELDCVGGGACSDEFSPTASPGSPLDSDEALDDLPPELLCATSVEQPDRNKSASLLSAGDQSHAKEVGKVASYS